MPVSSSLTTSAPRSASSSEQKPPGSSRVRSSTLMSLSGSWLLATRDPLRNTQQLTRLGHRGRPAADVLAHLPRPGDQISVRARHLAVGEVEVVLEARTDVAPERQRGADKPPLVAGDPDHLPVVRPLGAPRDLLRHERDVSRVGTDAAVDAD